MTTVPWGATPMLGNGEISMSIQENVKIVRNFLASSDSSFMTGSEVAVDGGLAQV